MTRYEWTDNQGQKWYAEECIWGADFGRVLTGGCAGNVYDEEIKDGDHPIQPPAREILRLVARVRELEAEIEKWQAADDKMVRLMFGDE